MVWRWTICLKSVIVAASLAEATLPASGAPRSAGSRIRDCEVGCPDLIVVPAGSFRMGADAGEEGRPEGGIHTVSIAKSFALGAREVSNSEFEQFIRATGRQPTKGCRSYDPASGKVEPNPASTFRNPGLGAGEGKPNMPVVCVSWTDARDYTVWLSKKTGKPYRLPSEAEWEYAARAGTETPFFWGNNINASCSFANTLDEEWINARVSVLPSVDKGSQLSSKCSDGHAGVAPVGSYKPNAFGLYDMIGNVWEWLDDCYVAPYPTDVPTDGSAYHVKGPCPRRVVRSGSWMTVPFRNRVTWRGRDPETLVSWIFGFRVARDLTRAER